MKLNILQVVTLCACLGQIHSWSNELPANMKIGLKNLKPIMMLRIYDVSEKFVDDYIHFYEMTRGEINEYLLEGLVDPLMNQNNAKIDAEYIRGLHVNHFEPDYVQMDNIKILQSVSSKRMAPEQYNGLINLLYLFKYPNATSAQIESALNYLYGVDDAATRTSFLNPFDFPDPSAKDCPDRDQQYTDSIDKLKLTIDLRPKVIQDVAAIQEKFPCNKFVRNGLANFVNVITQLSGDKSKIGACMLKENLGNWEGIWAGPHPESTRENMEYLIEGFESVLFTRLPSETVYGIINLLKANIPGTPIGEIEKALEYLYDDLPETSCT